MEIYSYIKIFTLAKRNVQIWTSEQTYPDTFKLDSDIELNDIEWKKFNEPNYQFVFQNAPKLGINGSLTNNMNFSDAYSRTWISQASEGFFPFVSRLMSVEKNKLDTCKDTLYYKTKSFRLELTEDKKYTKENSLLNIDGEKYYGSKVQGTQIDDQRVFFIA